MLTDTFKYYQVEQRQPNWCWAACIQMVANYQGVPIEQSTIVEKAYGVLIDRGAGCPVMQNAATGWSYNGITLKASSIDIGKRNLGDDLIDQLAFKYPVIVGINMPNQGIGHALVLTAVYFYYDNSHNKIPYQVTLRDPWPYNPNTCTLSWGDFTSRLNCIVEIAKQ